MFEKKGDLFGVHQKAAKDFFSVDEFLNLGSISSFLFRMQGEALRPYISDGDLLVVDRSLNINHGDYILASVNETFMCRRYELDDQGAKLVSREGALRLNLVEQFVSFGIVRSIVRKLK